MKLVTIVHPEVGESKVPESAVNIWRHSGWVPKGEADTAERAPSATEETKPRTRRKSEGEV